MTTAVDDEKIVYFTDRVPKITGRAANLPLPFQTRGEEIANSILHGFGVFLAAAGLALLILREKGFLQGSHHNPWAIIAYVIYSVSMIGMFLASTTYHAAWHKETKQFLRVLDHSAVYLFIAGTYTPFCFLVIRGTLGWAVFIAVWALAITGIIIYAIDGRRFQKIELAICLLLGWAIVPCFFSLIKTLSPISFTLLIGGGIIYTMGTILYRKPHIRGAHITWHAFVLAGAIGHWLSIWWL
jgi:hemolysin III